MAVDLLPLLDRTLPCSGCGTAHVVRTRTSVVASDSIEEALPAFLRERGTSRAILVADSITWDVAGGRTERALTAGGIDLAPPLVIPAGAQHAPHCDDGTVARVERAVREAGADMAVAVGSGTVNDLVKAGADRAGAPYVVVATAASMNGYTSGIAAVLSDGVKRTLPFAPTLGVFADPAQVAAAPAPLTRAGLGDLLSKSVCGADWLVSHLLQGAYWCELPGEIVTEAEAVCIAEADAIGRGDPEAVGTLLEALLVSGISMVVAGSSAPASGGEHLFSHLLDMRRTVAGEPLELHGAQVGIGTLATAALYELLLEVDVPSTVDVDALVASHPSWEEERARIERIHGPLAEEIARCYADKYRDREEQRTFVEQVVARWSEVSQAARATVRPLAELRGALEGAGAVVRATDIGVTGDEARALFLYCRDLRARYTVLDLAWDLGLLETLADRALANSGILR